MARFAVVLVLALGALAAVAWAALDDTELVSRASGASGAKADQPATLGNVSGDGSRTAFSSMADNLSNDDGVESEDVYVRDTSTATTVLVSLATDGEPADNTSSDGRISADGGHVAFTSSATNLADDDFNESADVFVRDLESGTTTLVSRADGPDGAPAFTGGSQPAISADGRYVAFVSDAINLPGGELTRVFVRDVAQGTTTHVSVPATSNGPSGIGDAPSISAGGGRVAFTSQNNLHPDDTDDAPDVYVRDLAAGETILVTRASGGEDASGTAGQISGNGRSVSFASSSPNLGGPASGAIYVRDLEARATTLASRATGAAGAPGDTEIPGGSSISDDGRSVAFAAQSTNLHPDDTDTDTDVFLRDLESATTTLVSRASGATGAPGDGLSTRAAISADGLFVAFQSSAPNLHPDDADRLDDVFARRVRELPPEPPIIVEPPPPPPPPVVIVAPPPPPPGAPQPVAGRRELVQPVRGRVRVRVRGTRRFVRLRAGRLLPDRSEIDTTNGVARVVVAAVRDGSATASALVSRGRAIVDQDRARRPTTTLRLSERLSCARSSGASSAQKKKRKKRRRLFTETDGGRFRTRGGFGSAAASGTAWLTTDRCNSTRIGVREGTVRVRDLGRRRTVTLRAGSTYTARKRDTRRP